MFFEKFKIVLLNNFQKFPKESVFVKTSKIFMNNFFGPFLPLLAVCFGSYDG